MHHIKSSGSTTVTDRLTPDTRGVSPVHTAHVLKALDVPPPPVLPAWELTRWLTATATAIETAHRDLGAEIALTGLAASGVLNRYSVREATRVVEFFEDLAFTLGGSGAKLGAEAVLSDDVLDELDEAFSQTPNAQAVFADIVAVIHAARAVYAGEHS